jgi:hypothetical protein
MVLIAWVVLASFAMHCDVWFSEALFVHYLHERLLAWRSKTSQDMILEI